LLPPVELRRKHCFVRVELCALKQVFQLAVVLFYPLLSNCARVSKLSHENLGL